MFLLRKNYFIQLFPVRKSCKKKKSTRFTEVQTRYKGENRSPRIFHDVKNSRNVPFERSENFAMFAQNKEGYRYVCSMHAIGHDMQTLYVAPVLRAIASKNKFASTRDSLPLEGGGPRSGRRSSGRVPRAAESLALSGLPRDAWSPIESELADRAAVYFEQPDCSKAALPLVRVRTRR